MAADEHDRSEKAWDERLDAEQKQMRFFNATFAGGLANMMLLLGAVLSGKVAPPPVAPTAFFIGALLFLRGFWRTGEYTHLTVDRNRLAFQAQLQKQRIWELQKAQKAALRSYATFDKQPELDQATRLYADFSEARSKRDAPREAIVKWLQRALRVAVIYAVAAIFIFATDAGQAICRGAVWLAVQAWEKVLPGVPLPKLPYNVAVVYNGAAG